MTRPRKTWPSIDLIKRRLRYDPKTGNIYHLPREPHDFPNSTKPEATAKTFNTLRAGKEWGQVSGNGHRLGEVEGTSLWAQHVAWMFIHGDWPDSLVAHHNGDYTDNRPENLYLATRENVSRNKSLQHDNKSGVSGVYFDEKRRKWVARIKDKDRSIWLGRHDTFAEARAARFAAERDLGYHENHGRRPSRFTKEQNGTET